VPATEAGVRCLPPACRGVLARAIPTQKGPRLPAQPATTLTVRSGLPKEVRVEAW